MAAPFWVRVSICKMWGVVLSAAEAPWLCSPSSSKLRALRIEGDEPEVQTPTCPPTHAREQGIRGRARGRPPGQGKTLARPGLSFQLREALTSFLMSGKRAGGAGGPALGSLCSPCEVLCLCSPRSDRQMDFSVGIWRMGRGLKGRGCWLQPGPGPETHGLKDNLSSRCHSLPSPTNESLESQGARVLVQLLQPSRVQKEEEISPDKQHSSAQSPSTHNAATQRGW